MNVTHMVATLQVYIKQMTDKDVVINPNVPPQDLGKLMHMYNIAKKWLNKNVI